MILLLIAQLAFAQTSGILTANSIANPNCKWFERKQDCNSCSCEKCHDDKIQWDTGICMCTAVACTHQFNQEKFNPKEWQ